MVHRSSSRFVFVALLQSAACLTQHPMLSARTALRAPVSTYQLRAPVIRADESFTETQKLRAEVESPFAQVRLFALPVLFAAAGIATYFGATALLASAVGAREASPTAVQDLVIDLGSMGAIGFFWRRELTVRDARLKRIAFGSKLAALRITQLAADGGSSVVPAQSVSLSDLRRGRGQSRRVVVLCAPEDKLRESLEAVCASAKPLLAADILVVPLLTSGTANSPQLTAPPLAMLQELAGASTATPASVAAASAPVKKLTDTQPPLPWDEAVPDVAGSWPVALPQSTGAAWTDALAPELEQAAKQDGAIMERGLTIVLKKNGRVGTRRLGMPNFDDLLADVEGRRLAGMDVTNI